MEHALQGEGNTSSEKRFIFPDIKRNQHATVSAGTKTPGYANCIFDVV